MAVPVITTQYLHVPRNFLSSMQAATCTQSPFQGGSPVSRLNFLHSGLCSSGPSCSPNTAEYGHAGWRNLASQRDFENSRGKFQHWYTSSPSPRTRPPAPSFPEPRNSVRLRRAGFLFLLVALAAFCGRSGCIFGAFGPKSGLAHAAMVSVLPEILQIDCEEPNVMAPDMVPQRISRLPGRREWAICG